MAKPVLFRDNSQPKNFLESLQTAVINRYSKPYGGGEPIVYEFTQDRALIHQYHTLLETMYRRMYNAQNFRANVDVYDKLSYILVARRDRLCLGGCRLTIREGDEQWNLPLESEEFKLREVFPYLPLDRVRQGELSRFAVMEDSGGEDIFHGLCKVMYDQIIALEIHYLFAKSTYLLARNWRMLANNLGIKTTRICKELEVPDHPIIKDETWYITMSDLSSMYKAEEVLQPHAYHTRPPSYAEKARLALVES